MTPARLTFGIFGVATVLGWQILSAEPGRGPATSQPDGNEAATASIYNLPVRYAATAEKGIFGAGFIDHDKKIFYRWNGLILSADQVPNTGPLHRLGLFDPVKKNVGYQILSIDPPIRYLIVGKELVAPGFLDESSHLFFRWRNVEMDSSKIPTTGPQYRVLDPQRDALTVVEVPAPRAEAPASQPSDK